MSDEQALSPAVGVIKIVDPDRWSIQFDLEVQQSIVKNWRKPSFERGISKEEKAERLEEDAEQLKLHKQAVAELTKRLEAYDADPGKARITICLMDPVKLTDIIARRSILLGKPRDDLEAVREQSEIDRETMAWGVCGHEDIELAGKPVPFEQTEVDFDGERHTIAARRTVKEYERKGWRVSLPAAIMRFNQLTEEKKSG